jgi:hypothetical protein
MRRKLAAAITVLFLGASIGSFAEEKKSSTVPWLVSYNSPGTIDLTVTGGFTWWGLGLNAGLEYTISRFDLGTAPLSWGITAQGSGGFNAAGIGVAVDALATLNIGFDFGGSLKFEGFIGLGLGGLIETWGGAGSGFGIAQSAGWTWWFSNKLGLTVQEGYITALGWGYWYYLGLGATLKI